MAKLFRTRMQEAVNLAVEAGLDFHEAYITQLTMRQDGGYHDEEASAIGARVISTKERFVECIAEVFQQTR